jgi:hypothetical protein
MFRPAYTSWRISRPLDAHHVPAGIYVLEDQPAGRLLKVAPRRDNRLAWPCSQWAGFVTFYTRFDKLSRQAINLARFTVSVHHQQAWALSYQETISRNRIRIAKILLLILGDFLG